MFSIPSRSVWMSKPGEGCSNETLLDLAGNLEEGLGGISRRSGGEGEMLPLRPQAVVRFGAVVTG